MNFQKQNCYEFWNLAKSLRINDIVALWCNVEPSDFNHFQMGAGGFMPSCADAKKSAIQDALIYGELDYIDEGIPIQGRSPWIGGDTLELIQKDRLRIEKSALKEWFINKYENGELPEIPTFLDKEKQRQETLRKERANKSVLPNGEMTPRNKNTAIKIMYALLIKSGWDNTYPTSQNRGSANTEIATILDSLGLSVGYETIGKFLKEVQDLSNEYPYTDPKEKPPF